MTRIKDDMQGKPEAISPIPPPDRKEEDTKENLTKIAHADFDRIVLVATSPVGSEACQKAMASVTGGPPVQLLTWLDIS